MVPSLRVNTVNGEPDGAVVPAGAVYGGQIGVHPFAEVQFETSLPSPVVS